MAQTWHRVRIEEASDDLIDALSVRGLAAHRANGAIEVDAFGEEGIWNLEVVSALEAWLEDQGREEVTARIGDVEYTVRSPDARRLEDTGELTPASRGRSPDRLALAAAIGTILLLAAGVWLLLAAGFRLF